MPYKFNPFIGNFDKVIETNPAGSDGEIQFNASDVFGADSNLYWDNVNKRIGLGTKTPESQITLKGDTDGDEITSQRGFNIDTVDAPVFSTTPTVVGVGNVETGIHYYFMAYKTALGSTRASDGLNINLASPSEVQITIPATSDPRVIGYILYRTKANASSCNDYQLYETSTPIDLTSGATYNDNISDASLDTSTWRAAYGKSDSTSNYVMVDGVRSMIIDQKLTTLGYNTALYAGAAMGSSVFIGANAGRGKNSSNPNSSPRSVFIGQNAGVTITTGGVNVCIGENSGSYLETGGDNVLIGGGAGQRIVSGTENVCIGGYNAMSNVNGSYNLMFGSLSGYQSTSLTGNLVMGYYGARNINGSYNILLGHYAGYHTTAVTSVSNNIIIGAYSGQAIATGAADNILIGYNIELPVDGDDFQLNIGNLIFGTGLEGKDKTISTGKIGIGVVAPSEKLEVNGTCLSTMHRQAGTWHAFGGFQEADYEITLTTQNTWYHVTNGTNDLWTGLEADGMTLSGDVLTITNTGDYFGSLSMTISGSNGKDFEIRVYNITQSTQMAYVIGATTTGDTNYTNITLPLYIEATAGDTFRMEIRCTSNAGASPQLRSAVFTLQYLHD